MLSFKHQIITCKL